MAKSWSAPGTVNKPVNASKAPKGTIFGAPNPMKKKMNPKQKMAVKKKKVGNAAEKQMFGMK